MYFLSKERSSIQPHICRNSRIFQYYNMLDKTLEKHGNVVRLKELIILLEKRAM